MLLFAKMSATFMRPDVDPHAQMELIKHHPLRAAGIVAADLAHHAVAYGEQMIGTLGWLNVPLPSAAILAVVALLVLVALFAARRLSAMQRLLTAVIAIASIVTVELSEYVSWTAAGANGIDGGTRCRGHHQYGHLRWADLAPAGFDKGRTAL